MDKNKFKKEKNYNTEKNNYSVKEHDEQFIKRKPNKRLMKALEESEKILNDKTRKGYSTIEELMTALDNDD